MLVSCFRSLRDSIEKKIDTIFKYKKKKKSLFINNKLIEGFKKEKSSFSFFFPKKKEKKGDRKKNSTSLITSCNKMKEKKLSNLYKNKILNFRIYGCNITMYIQYSVFLLLYML